MQKCQTHYMGRTCGWHLAASGGGVLPQLIPQEAHAETVYREGRKKGRRGRADIAYYVFPSQLEKASAVLGWECWWISVVSGEH